MTKARECLYFATNNDFKFEEFARLFRQQGVKLQRVVVDIAEIQTIDIEPIVRDKVVKAYSTLGCPVLVDHSGMRLRVLGGLPGGLNRQFWHVLQEKICVIAHRLDDPAAEIIVSLAVCDGHRIYCIEQRDPGRIAMTPATCGTFHLDRVFVPRGSDRTLAEMSRQERDATGYRGKAARRLVQRLRRTALGRSLGLRS